MNDSPIDSIIPAFAGNGKMSTLMRQFDWSANVVGHPDQWSQTLSTILDVMLHAQSPMLLWWGPEFIQFYNDAYRHGLADSGKHPAALGQRGDACWTSTWPQIKPLIDQAMAGGEGTRNEDQPIPVYRNGRMQTVNRTYVYSPVWEASGTSGMKVLVNGGINLSELDGWWAEAYTPKVGWALGDMQEHGNDPAWDDAEANALYELLEQQIVPEFYNRDQRSIPVRWVERMRQSMATLTPQFSANRTVREYTETYYLPAASRYCNRIADKGAAGNSIIKLRQAIGNEWHKLSFGEVTTESIANGFLFHVPVMLSTLTPDQVLVELYAAGINGETPVRIPLETNTANRNGSEYIYTAMVTTHRPASDFTARILPAYEGIVVPLEDNRIRWQQ